MTTVSLIDVATYLPENRFPAEWYTQFSGNDALRDNPMFPPPAFPPPAADDAAHDVLNALGVAARHSEHGDGGDARGGRDFRSNLGGTQLSASDVDA